MKNLDEIIQRVSHSPWLPRAVASLLVIMISWWAVAEVLPLFHEEDAQINEPVMTKTIPVKQTTKPISDLNLFGEEHKIIGAKPVEVKVTKLNLILRGILATVDHPDQGYAQIENAKKEERFFSVKDSIFGQATLEEIYIDRVIILHNGIYETLKLPEEFLNVKHFSIERKKLERKKIATDFRNLFLSRDVEKLRKLFGFDTAYKNGGFVGFIVKALSDKGSEMMATLGVVDGDLIVVVNGLRFSESLEAAQQLTELKTATSVDIIIERDGQEIPFHIEFDAPIEDIADVSGGSTQGSNASKLDVDSHQQDSTANIDDNNTATSSAKTSNVNNSTAGGSNSGGSSSNNSYSGSTSPAKSSAPEIPFDERPEAEEFKRLQRERTGINAPVEYDH